MLVDGGDARLVLRDRGNPADDAHGWTIRSEGDVLRFLSPNGLQATLHPFNGFNVTGTLAQGGAQVFHTSNDGAGSGMDADLLDGQQGSWYGDIPARLGYTPLRASDITDVWRSSNDGAGSGLDADMLDGRDGDWYRRWANLLDVPGAFPPNGHTHGAADLAGAFPGSLAENGWTVLPNGLILQWVTGAGMAAGDEITQAVYFPIAFPNACFGALAGSRDDYFSTAADVMFSTVGAPSLDSVTVARKQFSERASDRVPSRAFVIAIGR
jgi:hypothetical protein